MRQASENYGKKVYVGLSGGVDSAVSAALLKRAGFEVTGVFIKSWQPPFVDCPMKEDRLDAMRVCAALNIPFLTLNLEKEYKRDVVDHMISEYEKGRVPNPDVMCNRYIKFGGFYDWAIKNGADFVATGHYAQKKDSGNTFYELCEGKDKNKDQSYFLWTLKQDQLKNVLFPMGHLEKTEVRKLAKEFKLPVADKKDSQGLCFMGKIDMKEFLKKHIKAEPGDVLDEDGNVMGRHDGTVLYALGERHGFSVFPKSRSEKPYYVISKDLGKNTITVSPKNSNGDLPDSVGGVLLGDINWFAKPENESKYQCRFRYRQMSVSCSVQETDGEYTILFDDPQSSVSPGQSLVVYSGDKVMGGGIIQTIV